MKALLTGWILLQPFIALAASFPDAVAEQRAAVEAEQRQDWAGALEHYERLYDSTPTNERDRSELRSKFTALRPKVPPNTNPAKAGVWKAKAFAFRTLDFAWTDQDKKEHRVRYRLREDEIEKLRKSQAAFAERVWNFSSGNLRVVWDLQVIDEPLSKMDGEFSFWPGPGACMPFFHELKPGEADTIFVYAKVHAQPGKDEPSEDLPLALLGGALGVLDETKGATYIGINMIGFASTGGYVEGEPAGEAELHEWLHSVQWTLEDFQSYPPGLMASSDTGRVEGESGGDPCFRRKKDGTSWVPFYEHIMQAHITRKMWRELSLSRPPQNIWASAVCRQFSVLGPFEWQGKPNSGLDESFINESAVSLNTLRTPPGRKWQPALADGAILDLAKTLGQKDYSLAYLAVNARAQRETPAKLWIGSDDGCKLWLKGKLLLTAPEPRACSPGQDVVSVTLNRGDNLLLLKVANLGGGWAATLRVTDSHGNPIPTLQYQLP
jgi:hypothetical protein